MRAIQWAVGVATALSAFLLFLVQPLVARQILPWFGGSAAVWSTCLLFFQALLLAGYLYADWMVHRVPPRRQAVIHTSLLALSLLALPLSPPLSLKPIDASLPVPRILLVLAVTVGVPYLLLSTTGPLLQAWYTRRLPAANVWRLYALSNLFSLLALVAYPGLFEPLATTAAHARWWSLGYVALALLLGVIAWRQVAWSTAGLPDAGSPAADRAPSAVEAPTPPAAAADGQASATGDELEALPGLADRSPDAGGMTRGRQAQWLVLAALSSVLLLALTTHLTQNVASVPLLWVLPLGLYLLTFVLCFDGRGWYWRRIYPPLAALATMAMMLCLSFRPDGHGGLERALLHLHAAVPLYAGGLLVLCMFLHGELVARKPQPQGLTRFYLLVSLGGALGGTAVALVAPMVFDDYWELPLALFAAACLVATLAPHTWQRVVGGIAVLVVACLAVDFAVFRQRDVVAQTRNFYGTLRVKAAGPSYAPQRRMRLVHGTILHGEQSMERRDAPSTYYGATSGIGHALLDLRTLQGEAAPQRVGLVGLGVGTLTAYARRGDHYRLYELNPAVPDLARRHFTYLADCAGDAQVVLGDARLSLEREPPQQFDVLAVDAFSSDSIPVHLMTQEALAVYLRHLRPGGVVVFHVSNRYLKLAPVVRQLAATAGLQAWQFIDAPPKSAHLSRSDWVAVTANTALLQAWRDQGAGQPVEPLPGLRLWRDDQYDLLQVLK